MRRIVAIVALGLFAFAPALSVGQSSSDEGSEETSETDADAEKSENEEKDDESKPDAPENLPATQFASMLGGSWSGRSGCQSGWKGVWKVAGGQFSLVAGSTSGASGSAFHAVCDSYRSIGPYGSPKVTVTLLGGVIHHVAVLAGGGSAEQKSKMVRYFESACDSSSEAGDGKKYDTVYEACGGFDVGLPEGESDLSLYFFADEAVFRSRMNSLPMPTKPDN